ncbi:MAG: PepSY domain-containing protein [Rudaea sp.]
MKRRAAIAALTALFAAVAAWAGQITLQQAIAKVERETHAKVLSAETKHYGKHTIYRIKVLTRDGQVRVIEVPAEQN